MQCSSTKISYQQTNSFSKLVVDYLNRDEALLPFYKFESNLHGIEKAIEQRSFSTTRRNALVQYFNNAYSSKISEKQLKHIELLKKENCYTITTAHQPNIFTGPLYVIYKILHTIKLAETLQQKYTDKNFVPVFFMGSEDADLDELGNISIQHKKLVWQTKQTGAVGRMLVDDDFLKLIEEIKGQIGVLQFGNELSAIFSACYTKGKSIQQATFELINNLFAEYGLLVLIPDDKLLKQQFIDVLKKEICTSFSHQIVEETNQELSKHHKTQASGRAINLFYLIEDKRVRIEKVADRCIIEELKLSFTQDEMLAEVETHPERFSPNVILRPVFQETILPNIAFIGGGGELAYWMQLKKVFEAVQVDYPVLVLRNSFLLINKKVQSIIEKLKLKIEDLFYESNTLINQFVVNASKNNLNFENEIEAFKNSFSSLKNHAEIIDKSLIDHLAAIETKTIKKIEAAEKKLLRAEKRKYAEGINQLQKIKEQFFPNNSLQERVENFSFFYAMYGKDFLKMIVENSLSLEQEFNIITIES